MWDQLQPTGPHVSYLVFSTFLLLYALFSQFIRSSLHLSEPPLAVLFGIILGPYCLQWITPQGWGIDHHVTHELTRIIVGIQCFAVGIELPKFYFTRHWASVFYMLGPIMTFSWAITALFAYLIFKISLPAALIIGACLSPTDPVLAASIFSKSKFSERVPRRLKHLLLAESACNDGISFPFLYIGIMAINYSTAGISIKEWFLITILWQCTLGLALGLVIGRCANCLLRISDDRGYISSPSFIVFYLLLAMLTIGVGSTLGSNDFLVAFGAGVGFAHDGWFWERTHSLPFPNIINLILNSSMFVFFGSIIPFQKFAPRDIAPNWGIWQLLLFLFLVLFFRRIPIVLALQRLIPDIRTWREALFCGHFGPMGVGALFLAMESREKLERDTNTNPGDSPPSNDRSEAIRVIWPVICFVVLGSTMVHGLSMLVISLARHFGRQDPERAPLLGTETEGLGRVVHGGGGMESDLDISGSETESQDGSE
ncbi:uncharacterized protein BP5553_08664 [Venustampulla echinocandica]|uniref:Cation/H+ exchanger transmembrane domain-containing protein n=1 Tax=Venustampulla echinocandica TaxID=2656787 RepID=A0A370TEV3_9HELO|nr:uncharacterized protein BP5553_08664 [Venustampulla echinocandica]RDL33225.1 hypothetical protein BP5553_08664 [Venustampulla echinocandica]